MHQGQFSLGITVECYDDASELATISRGCQESLRERYVLSLAPWKGIYRRLLTKTDVQRFI